MAVTREQVLHAMADVALDAQGTKLIHSGRLSDVIVDAAGRVMFSIFIDPPEAHAMESVRLSAGKSRPRPAGRDRRICNPYGGTGKGE